MGIGGHVDDHTLMQGGIVVKVKICKYKYKKLTLTLAKEDSGLSM